MIPLMTSFGAGVGLGKKRKKPEVDFIDEMLGEDENLNTYNHKKGKINESSDKLMDNPKSSATKSNSSPEKRKTLNSNSDIS